MVIGKSYRHEMLSQKSPSPRQHELMGPTASGGYCSPEREGGHTERTNNKGRTLRFNLQECALQGSSTNEQNSMHHRPSKTMTSHSNANLFQPEKSYDQMDHQPDAYWRNQDSFSVHHQPSLDSKSAACRSECLSEHYIRAKKFAAFRTN